MRQVCWCPLRGGKCTRFQFIHTFIDRAYCNYRKKKGPSKKSRCLTVIVHEGQRNATGGDSMKANRLRHNGARASRLMYILEAAVKIGAAGVFIAAGFILGSQLPVPLSPQIAGNTGGPERYVTHVSTDKPIYRIGEKVYIRAVVLNAISHYPMTNPGTASFEIKGPKGETV